MIKEYFFENALTREDIRLGLVVVHRVKLGLPQPKLEDSLKNLLEIRRQPLSSQDEEMRQASRDMLRNGKYRPTGRSKPASEYLLREAAQNQFPRINAVVDIINYLSLKYMVPISLWDIDLAKTKQYRFRLGKSQESYIFNSAGQTLDLEDLICGYGIRDNQELPMITPVKDSLATKTIPESTNIAMVIYYSVPPGTCEKLQNILLESQDLFAETTGEVIGSQIV